MAHPLDKYRHLIPDESAPREYWKRLAINEFTSALGRLLGELGMDQAQLARALRVRGSTVNRVLRGHQNLTIDTMSKYADVLGAAVHVVLLKKGSRWRVIDEGQGIANKVWSLGRRSALSGFNSAGRMADNLTFLTGVKSQWKYISPPGYFSGGLAIEGPPVMTIWRLNVATEAIPAGLLTGNVINQETPSAKIGGRDAYTN
jgi:transcriptional regulator with XRE-family HTH domain